MFAYCSNLPTLLLDINGTTPTYAYDINGDGKDDCFVYEYEYTTGWLFWTETHIGRVYIYTGVEESFFEKTENIPSGFNKNTDLMVGDFTNQDNPNMYAYQAHKVDSSHRGIIIEKLLEYDSDFNTSWNRTRESLMTEWVEHHKYRLTNSAQNIDFDNNEEGKDSLYFWVKAINRVIKKGR